MLLTCLLDGVDVVRGLDANPDIKRMSCEPKEVDASTLFVAYRDPWPGAEGRDDLREAARRGAAAILVEEGDERLFDPPKAQTIVVPHANQTYATVCANFFGNAHRELRLYGVTGTKGKTTTCHLIESIFRSAGFRTGLISTLVWRVGRRQIISRHTTPEPFLLHSVLAKMRAAGVTHVIVEASSIGLAEDRLHGLRFDAVVLTNLGSDHLDYHKGLGAYKAAKRRLFTEPAFHNPDRSVSVLNTDDEFGVELAADTLGTVITYGMRDGAVKPSEYEISGAGLCAIIGGVQFESRLIGAHSLFNVLAAVALTQAELGFCDALPSGVRDLSMLPGRFERVAPTPGGPGGIDVFVDCAHTPESVLASLSAAKTVAGNRPRVVVIGCRGGGDRGKRAPIGEAAIAHSDVCVVTSNNPNREDPREIMRDMLAGVPVDALMRSGRLALVVDRREAIYRAVEAAAPDGVVMILGKGSQTTQSIGGRELPFDDREIAKAALRSVQGHGG